MKGNLGVLRTEWTEYAGRAEIIRLLGRLGGGVATNITVQVGRVNNFASVRFTYKGQNYEFKSTAQKNCFVNLAAVVQLIDAKTRFALMNVENFGAAMMASLMIENRTSTPNGDFDGSDVLTPIECDILGVGQNASNEEVREARSFLLKQYHPDKFFSEPEYLKEAQEKTSRINAAYEQIMKRRGFQ